MRRVFNSFKMPAVHMFFDGRRRVEAINSMHIFDEAIFLTDVYEPLLARLGLTKNDLRARRCTRRRNQPPYFSIPSAAAHIVS